MLTLLLLNKNLLEDEANTQKSRTKKWRLRVFLTLSLKCLAFVSGMPGTQWVLGCIFCEVTFSDQHMRTPRSWFLKYGTEHNLFNPLLPFIQSLNIYYVAGETSWSHVSLWWTKHQKHSQYITGHKGSNSASVGREFHVRMEGTSPQGVMLGGFKDIMETRVDSLFFCLPFSCEGWLCRQCVL